MVLNKDKNSVRTPAFWDANLNEWAMASANVVKTEGGLFVFQRGTDDGRAKVDAQLTGSKAEQASAQDTQLATVAKTYNRAVGATQMEVYCESGYIRVRTDGQPCTSTTGEPIAVGFGACWAVGSISVFYVQESIVTVVSR